MTRRVLVVGDAMLDVVVRPEGPPAPTSDTPARVRVSRGGSGANLALAVRAARPEFEVVYVGASGDDAAGQIVRRELVDGGVVAHLEVLEGSTGVVVALVGRGGERAMLTDRGVNDRLTWPHVASMVDESLCHVHVSGYVALDEGTRALVPRILEAAAQLGASTSIDVCSLEPLRRVGVATFRAAATGATMLFANEEEAAQLASRVETHAALEELAAHWREVVVTRGPRGALASHEGSTVAVDALDVGDALDTTGAGDCATGTYLAHRLAGDDPTTSLTRAMSAAAEVVARLGAGGQSRW